LLFCQEKTLGSGFSSSIARIVCGFSVEGAFDKGCISILLLDFLCVLKNP
jgi:hypothetical protein